MANQTTMEKHEFQTEVKQLLNLVVHSLYSHKDIFLRELISNSSDAIDKIRFESLTKPDILGDNTDFKIKLVPDKKKKTLTIKDNGIGMSKDELINDIGTIARSGTKEFLKKIEKDKNNPDLIGQFGVGFYSSFMVADKVTIITKSTTGQAYKWISDGSGTFEIEETEKQDRGTDVILELNKEQEKYLEEWELKQIIKKYSDYVEHPITMDVEKEETPKDKDGKEKKDAKPIKVIEEETLNSRKAIWAKSKNDISKEEYNEFYKHLSNDYEDPMDIIHYSAEGKSEFKALLYIPSKAPFDLFMRDSIKGISLYIKRVFIMNDCKKLIPEYFRFVRGVVDSNDLPLNVSREILQEDAELKMISKNLVKKIISTLKNLKDKEKEKYIKFYNEFGSVLKEGLHYDFENKNNIAELLLFNTTTTKPDEYRSLDEYIELMPKDQKDIYYINADDRNTALASPHLEIFKSKGFEVLLMTDTVDEFVINALFEYKNKKFKPVHKGDLDLDEKKDKKNDKEPTKEDKDILGAIQKVLETDIKEVRYTKRLTDSACCLVADEHAMSASMEKLFKQMGQQMPDSKRILELNPDHDVIKYLGQEYKENKDSQTFKDYISILYDQALLTEGSKLKDPLAFTKKISELMVKASK